MASLKVNVYFYESMLEARGLVKLGIFSGEELAFSSWWIILDAKLVVYVRMDLVSDMDTDLKRDMRQNTFGMPFPSCLYIELF